MAFTQTYVTIDRGSMIFTGNTLGLTNNGVQIQAFTSLNQALQVAGFPAGTTTTWQQNGSSAELTIPDGAKVLYAQLQWGGEYKNNVEDLSGVLNTPVTFITPNGTIPISPNPADSDIADLGGRGYYSNSQDVTSFVQTGGSGTYSVTGVPLAIGGSIATDGGGWTLGVVYQLDSLPIRLMTLYTGVEGILNLAPPIDINLSGFSTPASGTVEGRILLSAVEGDYAISGDQALFGADTSTLVPLSGPNNLADNFFRSQVNNGDSESPNVGQLDTTGTFGNINYPTSDPARYSWDITNVPITNLQNAQQQGVLRIQTVGDSYALEFIGIQIDVDAAMVPISKSTDKIITSPGEVITYTLIARNTGTVNADNVVVTDTIPAGTTFVPNSVTINGTSSPGQNPQNGINVGTLSPNESVRITFQVTADEVGTVDNTANVDYTFIAAPGLPPTDGSQTSNTVTTIVNTPFKCAAFGYRVAVPSGATNSSLTQINLITGQQTIINGDIGLQVNAIGYNTLDNLIYGIQESTTNLIVIDANGNISNLGPVPNLPLNPPGNYFIGAIDGDGHLFIKNGTDTTYYVINVDTSSPTFGQLVDPTNGFALDTAPFGTPVNPNYSFADWTFNSVDGNLYGVTSSGTVIRTNPFNGQMTALTSSGIPTGSYGSVYSVADDFIYATNNGTGMIYRIEISGNSATGLQFSEDIPSGINDGASCLDAELLIDFGDAPDTNPNTQGPGNYKTLLASNGPRHGVFDTIRLGNRITAENDALQNSTATGDDIPKGIQDDGTTLPLTNIALNATSYTINETVFNNTGQQANVYAWIDFNKNGIFETNEGVTAVVPSSPNNQTIPLTFNVPPGTALTPGDTFVRVRVTTDSLTNTGGTFAEDTRSFGAASNGEVEDYLLTIEDTQIISTKTASPANVDLGDIITYTVTLTNPGTLPISNVSFTDPLPNGTTYANNLTVSAPYTGTDPMTGLTITTIGAGETVTITWQVKVDENTIPNPNPIPNVGTVTIPTLPPTVTPKPETPVNNANLEPTKTVDTQYAKVGDELTYTIKFTNTGSVNANNVVITDPVPSGTSLVSGSISSNVAFTTSSPDVTATLTNPVAPGETVTFTFKVKVDEIPNPNPIPNQAEVDYNYIVDPNQPPVDVNKPTNIVTTQINEADLISPGNFVKSVDKEFADIGDILTYTIEVTNTGNVAANNVIVKDPIPNGTSYVASSLTVDNVANGSNPEVGINIGNVNPGQTKTIVFKVKVEEIPNPNPIPNKANVSYTFIVDPTKPPVTETGETNEVTTLVKHGEIPPTGEGSPDKTADKNVTTPGDIVTYTVTATNTGNVDINDVVVKDIVPQGTSFIPGTTTINGVASNQDPNFGIDVGTVGPNQSFTITFKVEVLEGAPNPLVNTATIDYSYIVDPTDPPVEKQVVSPPVNVDVVVPNIELVKTSDRVGALVGDIIRYTIKATNTGDVRLDNVIVKDPLSPNLEFAGNVTIDNVVATGNIVNGINIGTLLVNESKTISFDAKVISLPDSGVITNTSSADYTYTVSGNNFNGSGKSNDVNVNVYNPMLDVTKTSSTPVVKVGDTFKYTITATNNGDILITDVIVKDNLPDAFEVIDISVDGTSVNGDIRQGVNIGNLDIDETKTVVLTLKVVSDLDETYNNIATATGNVTTDPNKPPSEVTGDGEDETGVDVYNPKLDLVKSVSKNFVVVGEVVTYTIVATNTGDIPLGNVDLDPIVISDILNEDLQFIAGTVSIDGVNDPTSGIVEGVDIGALGVGQSRTITFDAKVVSAKNSPIKNTSMATFGYVIPGLPPQTGTTTSNEVILNVDIANIDIEKNSNKEFVVLGDIITYTVTLTNTGTVNAINVIFKDDLPPGVMLIDGTFSVDGVIINSVNLSKGVNVGNIAVGQSKTITYQVKVINPNCNLLIINSASVKFSFILGDNSTGFIESEPSQTSVNEIELGITNFKQINIDEYLHIPSTKPNMEDINIVNGDIDIVKCHVIKTMNTISTEGQYLSGYKLVIHGVIREVVEYTACEDTQSVHSSHYDIPFSTFIILPDNYDVGSKIEVEGIVEDISYQVVDCRIFFTNATVLINAKILYC